MLSFLYYSDDSNKLIRLKNMVKPGDAMYGISKELLNDIERSNSSRTFPNKSLPEKGYFQAFEKYCLNGNHQKDEESDDTWESIGPVNQGGRMNALAVHPQNPDIVFAAHSPDRSSSQAEARFRLLFFMKSRTILNPS